MSRPRVSPNEVVEAVPFYLPDPRGHALLHGTAAAVNRALNRPRAVIESTANYSGWAGSPQSFRGLAASTRTTRALVQKNSQVSDERSTALSSASMRVFQQRAARGLA